MDDKTQAAEVRAAFEKSLASNTGSAQAFRRALASTASAWVLSSMVFFSC